MNKTLKSLTALTLVGTLFTGVSVANAADPQPGVTQGETTDAEKNVIDFSKISGSGSTEATENRPADPKPDNPKAIDVPGNGKDAKPTPSSNKKPVVQAPKAGAKAPAGKVLPKTSAVK